MTAGFFVVVDNEFNRHHYPSLIGQRSASPPSFAHVISERTELSKMDDITLVAHWNITQMSKRIPGSDSELNCRHDLILGELLAERGIPHDDDKLINRTA